MKAVLQPGTAAGVRSRSLFDFYLLGIGHNHLRLTGIRCDLAADTDALSFVVFFGFSKLGSVFAPDYHGEDLMGIPFVQVEKCRVPIRRICITGAYDFAAYGRGLAKVLF